MSDAMRIADRPLPPDYLRLIQRDLYELSKPFIAAKMSILNVTRPTYRISQSKMTVEYSPEVNAQFAEIDRVWAEARNNYLARFPELRRGDKDE